MIQRLSYQQYYQKQEYCGFVILILIIGIPKIGYIDLAYVLGWIGAITAISGTMMAIFQEDAKKLLAYSSMGQVWIYHFSNLSNDRTWMDCRNVSSC